VQYVRRGSAISILQMKIIRSLRFSAALAFLAIPCLAGSEKLAAELRQKGLAGNVEVIVSYRAGSLGDHHKTVIRHGGSLRHSFDFIGSGHYSVPAASLSELADDPDVLFVSPDRPVKEMLDIVRGAVYADAVQKLGYDGAGVGVAIIDSGIADMPEFKGRVAYSESFAGGNGLDQYGHGTHVAGIVGARTGKYYGVAPGSTLINLRVLDENGSGSDSQVIAAINRAIQLKSTYNIRIINLSLGRPVYESYAVDPLCQAVEAAWKAGIVVVVAAGNAGRDNSMGTNGYLTITAPGNDPYAITVGAMKAQGTVNRSDDAIASYSSKGPTPIDHVVKPDLVAPGNKIVSTLPQGLTLSTLFPNNAYPAGHFMLSGTSMASAVVSGAAALLLEARPWLTPDQVKARLMATATKNFPTSSVAIDPVTNQSFTSYYDIFTIGAGYLDVQAALNSTKTSNLPALSPSVSLHPGTSQVQLAGVTGANVVWGSTDIWSTNVVWGTNVIWGSNVVWGTNVVWGSSVDTGFNVIWGSNVVWGTSSGLVDSVSTAINGEP
jgi:serine protease AprX